MFVKNICFVCLTDSDKNLKTVLQNEKENEIFTHVKYTLPELAIFDSPLPVYICSSCSITLNDLYTFKKKCLENYNRWKHYIQILEEISSTRGQRFRKLQIKVIDCEPLIKQLMNIKEEKEEQIFTDLQTKIDDNKPLIKQEPDLAIVSNVDDVNEKFIDDIKIKQENEVSSPSSSGSGQQIFNDIHMKIDDNKPLIKQEPELHIVSDYINEIVIQDNIVVQEGLVDEQEEIFIINLNVEDEEQNDQMTVVENNKEQEKYMDNVELISDDDEDCGTSGNSVGNKDKNEIISIDGTNSEKFKCILCKELCSDESTYNSHCKNHINEIRSLTCDICNETFSKFHILKRHMKLHFGLNDYECSICQKKYSDILALSIHQKIHSGTKNFNCELCDRKFYRQCTQQLHLKSHFGIKDFECTVCGKKFAYKGSLKLHLKIHAGIKDFECTICNKKYTQKANLKQHINSHFGIKEYECTVCTKRFATKRALSMHMDTHPGNTDYECRICKKLFIESSHLQIHMDYHLGIIKLKS